MPPRTSVALTAAPLALAVVLALFPATALAADSWRGKVVHVADGDTITVLRHHPDRHIPIRRRTDPVKVHLYGIDCPEKAQAFGKRAKQFTSKMVFGKVVRVEVVTTDRYKRTVARVLLVGTRKINPTPSGQGSHPYQNAEVPFVRHLNAELLRAGLAWHYWRYDKSKFYEDLEREARKAARGLWADPAPVAPWDWRRGKRGSSNSKRDQRVRELVRQAEAALKAGNFAHAIKIGPRALKLSPNHPTVLLAMGMAACHLKDRAIAQRAYNRLKKPERDQVKAICDRKGVAIGHLFHGNVKSKVFHAPGCRHFNCKHCKASFKSIMAARRSGYRPHKQCVGSVSAAPRPAPVAQPQPPDLPWNKDRVCKRDRDCVFADNPCFRCPPCKPTWREVTNRAARRRAREFFARHSIACSRCKPCPDGPSKWLGTKAVCVKGQCTVAGR
jgi:endonuclease YncB( thermonuclease family)